MRDAYTQRPIAGAWLSWRLPPPGLVARVLEDPAFHDPAFPMISAADGSFCLDRLPDDLPPASQLCAVARGYAYSVLPAGLRPRLVVELLPMASLEVELSAEEAAPRLELRSLSGDPACERVLAGLPPWGDDPLRFRVPHLPPGRYRARLLPRGPAREVELAAGALARLRLEPTPRATFAGTLAAGSRLLPEAELVLVDTEHFARHPLRTDRFGAFRGELPAGEYAVFWQEGRSERRLPGLLQPDRAAQLEAAETDEQRLAFTRAGAPFRSDALGLVALDQPLGSLLDLRPDAAPGEYLLQAPPGRYALFEDVLFLSELLLPRGDATPLELPRRQITVSWELPGELRDDEVLRGTVSLSPLLLGARPDLSERFAAAAERPFQAARGGPPLSLPLGAPGRYALSGRSDLGPFRHELELRGGEQLQLSLPGP